MIILYMAEYVLNIAFKFLLTYKYLFDSKGINSATEVA